MQRKSAVEYWFVSRRHGVSAPEVLVIVVIVGVVGTFVAMSLPRQRETARLAGCRRNLKQIGDALVLYEQATGYLPFVPETVGDSVTTSPLRALLEEGVLSEVTGDTATEKPLRRPANAEVIERPLPGLICASDPNAKAGLFRAPISYRATTGDAPDGANGAFAPGRHVRLADIEASDGASYTATFSERLVGDDRAENPNSVNYALVPGVLGQGGCPSLPATAWRGDAGSSWFASDWRSTLYNHVLTPNASPSCIAVDARTALMGASSGHVPGVNVLFGDGGVKTVAAGVDAKIWREWAAFSRAAGAGASGGSPPRQD